MSLDPEVAPAAAAAALTRALELSYAVLEAAEAGLAEQVLALDAKRRALLASARAAGGGVDPQGAAMVAQIRALNDRALGSMQHGMRRVEREMQTVSVGRRALAAYASAGGRR